MAVIDDTFIYGSYYSPVCSNCNNLTDNINHTCRAYSVPNKIPDKIWSGKHKHKTSFKGDKGILFFPVTKETLNLRVEQSKEQAEAII